VAMTKLIENTDALCQVSWYAGCMWNPRPILVDYIHLSKCFLSLFPRHKQLCHLQSASNYCLLCCFTWKFHKQFPNPNWERSSDTWVCSQSTHSSNFALNSFHYFDWKRLKLDQSSLCLIFNDVVSYFPSDGYYWILLPS
jgi:hypothetical protein